MISVSKTWHKWTSSYRDPRYIISGALGLVVLTVVSVQAIDTAHQLSSFDLNMFTAINNWPRWFLVPVYTISQLGSLSAVLIWAGMGVYARNVQAGSVIAFSGLAGWLLAKPLKLLVGRERPDVILNHAQRLSSENFLGLGYPSGHATVSAACATALYYYVAPRYRKYFLLVVFLVGISRIYLGGHFPGDIIGGWALGVVVGSLMTLLLGTQRKRISMPLVKRRLLDLGIEADTAAKLDVDARGSVPIIVTDKKGKEYFVKLFGRQEHAADWLFKVTRYFRFKSFSDEEPFLNSKRNVEHEALASLWAAKSGITTPEIYGYAKVGSYWMLVQESVPGRPLANMAKRDITDKTLLKIWKEVEKLQIANIAHRDLRPSNILVSQKGKPWFIDFGFAEVSARPAHKKMDIAELLMASALLIGVERALAPAKKILGREAIIKAAPYVQMAVFSGATTTLARKNKDIYKDLRAALVDLSDDSKIEDANIQRITFKRLINAVLIALFLFLVVPQFTTFSGALDALSDINVLWLVPIFIASIVSYISAALALVTLTNMPLKVRPTLLVQFACSFASKVLPGGLGPTTLLLRYLRKSGLDDTAAASLLVVQRFIDFIMFVLPVGLIVLLQGGSLRSLFKFEVNPLITLGVGITLLVGGFVLWYVKSWRNKITDKIKKTYSDFQDLASSPKELTLTALLSLGITASYVAALYFSLHAVGLDISPVAALIVYATATIAGSASPAPGGLGTLEIAMIAALIGLGYNQPQAYAAVILYRLATFWAPVPFGFAAYQYIQKKNII